MTDGMGAVRSGIEALKPAKSDDPVFKKQNRVKMNKQIHQTHTQHGYSLKETTDHLGIHYTTVRKVIKDMGEN